LLWENTPAIEPYVPIKDALSLVEFLDNIRPYHAAAFPLFWLTIAWSALAETLFDVVAKVASVANVANVAFVADPADVAYVALVAELAELAVPALVA
jgi:hypothetical protein